MEEGRKGNRTWLVVVVGLGTLALVARHLFPARTSGTSASS